jgi:hypothetical protein
MTLICIPKGLTDIEYMHIIISIQNSIRREVSLVHISLQSGIVEADR